VPSKSLPTHWIIAALILLVVIAAGGYLLLHQAHKTAPATLAAASTTPTPAASAPAPEYHPISEASVSPAPASTTPLPALDDSDGMLRDALTRLGGADAGKLLVGGSFIQRFVATVNALPGERLPSNVLPLHSPNGSFLVEQQDGATVMAPANARRYARYASLLEQADAQKLVDWYVHAYPLFQDAWRQLGYPKSQFNDRLVQVLDLLLKTPVPVETPQLEGADGLYRFVDPQLENLAIGQKILLRLSPAQETAVLAKLRAIRAKLVGRHPSAAPSQ